MNREETIDSDSDISSLSLYGSESSDERLNINL